MKLLKLTPLFLSLLLPACGGSGGSSGIGSPPPPATPSVAGIWQGANTGGGENSSIVDPHGNFFILSTDPNSGCNLFAQGSASSSGSSFTATGQVGQTSGCQFSDGSTGGTIQVTGTFVQGQSMVATSTVTTTNGTTEPAAQFTLNYNPLFSEQSSNEKLVGNWADGGATMTINADGSFFEQDGNGCTLNGTFDAEGSANVYTASVTLTNCPNIPNGFSISGLATLNDQVSPNQILFGLSGTAGNDMIFIAGSLVHE